MRIALVHQYFDFLGSLSRAHVELTRRLLDREHEVHVYSSAPATDRSLAPGAVFHAVPTVVAPEGRYGRAVNAMSFARAATSAISRDRNWLDVVYGRGMSVLTQDIINLPGVRRGERARFAAADPAHGVRDRLKRLGAPLLDPTNFTVRAILERRIFSDPNLAVIHADSRFVRDDLLAHYEIDPGRIVVVPPGVNLDEFTPAPDRRALRLELGLSPDDLLVLFCGHDFRRKGLDRAIQALACMRERATLVVLGGGAAAPYEHIAAAAGVAASVTFVGARPDAFRFFQAADVVLLPTRVDMWGAPVVEAMAVGAVPITTDAAGSSEVVEHGRNGFVFAEPPEPAAISATLDRLAAEPPLRAELATAGMARAAEHTWTRHWDRVEDDMRQVVERRSAGTPATATR